MTETLTLGFARERELAAAWFRSLRDEICAAFERLEALNREAGLGLPPATEADYSVPVPANFPTAVSAGETAIH